MDGRILADMASTPRQYEIARQITRLTEQFPVLGEKEGARAVGFDLDKTIIYGSSSFALPEQSDTPLRLVEFYKNKPLSFMTENSHVMLEIMAEYARVLPVTARRKDQFDRIMFPWGNTPDYVCLSGAIVCVDGKEDEDWTRKVQDKVASTSIPLSEIKRIIDSYENEDWILSRNTFGGMFEVITLDMANVPYWFPEEIQERVKGTGFFSSIQGRKLYLTPNELSKGDAFNYLIERLGLEGDTYGAGDSLMDVDLLEKVDFPFHPLHGEITDHGVSPKNSIASTVGGVLGGEEIVARVFASVVR